MHLSSRFTVLCVFMVFLWCIAHSYSKGVSISVMQTVYKALQFIYFSFTFFKYLFMLIFCPPAIFLISNYLVYIFFLILEN